MTILYNILFAVFSIIYVPLFIAKGKFGRGWKERFGVLSAEARTRLASRPVTWLHAVSVGEVGLALNFAERLREADPGVAIVLTTTTVAGREVAERLKHEEDELFYFPIDWPWAVSSFVRSLNPRRAVFFETEIWPNLMRELSRRRIERFIINGRLSDRSWGAYRSVRLFMRPVLRGFTAIGVQDETMRRRFVELGADPLKVHVTGNLKFDAASSVSEVEGLSRVTGYLKADGARLLVAGSTREGEEGIIGGVFKRLRARHPEWRLLIAPRHLTRLVNVEKDLERQGLHAVRVSTRQIPAHPGTDKDVYLLDEMGVLSSLYKSADAVFVGGSLVPTGGHNIAEPARYGKPVLYGPHMANFRSMAEEFGRSDAAVQVEDADALGSALDRLASDPRRREELGRRAKELVERHRGASARSLGLILRTNQ